MEKRLGKILKVTFGIGGYRDAMIGIHFTLGGDSWGVGDTTSAWDAEMIKHSEHCKWSESDRDKNYSDIMRYVSKLLKTAKVSDVANLSGIPIEATFDGNTLKEWRILTEVI